MLNARIQTLFDKETVEILKQTAREKKTSVGKLIRAAVHKDYISPKKKLQLQREKAFKAILVLRDEMNRSNPLASTDSVEIIRHMREERTQQILNTLSSKK